MKIYVNVDNIRRINGRMGGMQRQIAEAMRKAAEDQVSAVAFGVAASRAPEVGPALKAAMEFERKEVLTIFHDPALDDWQARARAAGMSEAEIERATEIASKSTAPMVIDGSASEVE